MRFLSTIIAAIIIPSDLTRGMQPDRPVSMALTKRLEGAVRNLRAQPRDAPTQEMVARVLSDVPPQALSQAHKMLKTLQFHKAKTALMRQIDMALAVATNNTASHDQLRRAQAELQNAWDTEDTSFQHAMLEDFRVQPGWQALRAEFMVAQYALERRMGHHPDIAIASMLRDLRPIEDHSIAGILDDFTRSGSDV